MTCRLTHTHTHAHTLTHMLTWHAGSHTYTLHCCKHIHTGVQLNSLLLTLLVPVEALWHSLHSLVSIRYTTWWSDPYSLLCDEGINALGPVSLRTHLVEKTWLFCTWAIAKDYVIYVWLSWYTVMQPTNSSANKAELDQVSLRKKRKRGGGSATLFGYKYVPAFH